MGWIVRDDHELFAGMYRNPLDKPTEAQHRRLKLIEHKSPMNIELMKEITGMLVKEITPALHQAFFIYEDQYNREWDRNLHNQVE